MIKLVALFFAFSALAFAKDYSSEGMKFTVETLAQGNGVIWGFDFINGDEILFSEREGKLKILNLKTGKTSEVAGAPKVFAESQGGLLDVFIDHGDVYLTYSDPVGKEAATSLFKGRLSEDKSKLIGQRIFQAKNLAKTGEHFGSRIAIDKDGFLFMSVGERYKDRDKAQSLSFHNGKILRLTKDGKAAPGNPFAERKDALPEIWSLGHRNPQGLIISNGVLWEAEFGPRGGDEVNIIEKGKNYGWPVATYGREYYGPKIGVEEKAGMVSPLYHWVPSINPSGIMIYSGKAFPQFEVNLFLASLAGHIHRVVFDKDKKMIKEEKLLEDIGDRFRQIRTGPDGLIYVSSDNGKIIRLKPL